MISLAASGARGPKRLHSTAPTPHPPVLPLATTTCPPAASPSASSSVYQPRPRPVFGKRGSPRKLDKRLRTTHAPCLPSVQVTIRDGKVVLASGPPPPTHGSLASEPQRKEPEPAHCGCLLRGQPPRVLHHRRWTVSLQGSRPLAAFTLRFSAVLARVPSTALMRSREFDPHTPRRQHTSQQ